MKKFHVLSFGLASGLTWGLFVLMLSILSMYSKIGGAFILLLSSVYLGTASTWAGAFIGLLWAIVDGFCGGIFFAFFYNWFAKKLN